MYRIGQSTDIHRLVEGRKLVLGGIGIPSPKGLLGHSDADVLLHAICEAILGALGKDDLGTMFPDNDPRYEGIASTILLKQVYDVMDKSGYKINNVDSLVIIEEPKLRPYIREIRENIASILHTSYENVNVKATCMEKMGFVGNKEGAIAQAIVMLESK